MIDRSGPSIGSTLKVAAICLLVLIGASLAGKASAQGAGDRKLLDARWGVLWTIGGTAEDTTLLYPTRLVADGGKVYVLDPGGPRVLAFFISTGKLAWTYGRLGSGPSEMRKPNAIGLRNSRLLIADAALSRITALDTTGRTLKETQLQSGLFVHDMCVQSDTSLVIVGPEPSGSALTAFGADGKVTAMLQAPELKAPPGLPFPPVLATAVPNAGGCVFAAQRQNALLMLQADSRIAVTPYIEGYTNPKAETNARGEPVRPRSAALAIATDNQRVIVAFEGASAEAGHILDFYSASTGQYQFSIPAPYPPIKRVVSIAKAGNIVVILYGRDGGPVITAYAVSGLPQ
jgi:hypothetical protein